MNTSKENKNNSEKGAKMRKSSLPTKPKISVNELKEKFKRQMSLPKENDVFALYDPMSKSEGSLHLVRKKTGVVFDELMNEHFCLWDETHIENPERLKSILRRLDDLNLLSECECLTPVSASEETIKSVHREALVEALKGTRNTQDVSSLQKLSAQFDSVYFNQKTYDASLLAAGCSIELTNAVLDGNIQNGMALVRPPGHHAFADECCGFCCFNNAALAAHSALSRGLQRVLIVDWDVHHGQGTQRLFYDDPRVLFFSSHRYEDGLFWPHLRESHSDYIGEGPGKGFNFNIPFTKTHMKNEDFLAFFYCVILPVSYEFNPELVIVSCGFDATLGCEEGMMLLTPALFAHLTSLLMPLAQGKVVVLLEGGYYLESLAESAMHTLRTLMGYSCPKLIDAIGPPCDSMCQTIQTLISHQRPYWNCFSSDTEPKNVDSNLETIVTSLDPSSKFVFKGYDAPPMGTPSPLPGCRNQFTEDEIVLYAKELKRLKEGTCLKNAPNGVCLSYDADMEKHYNICDKRFPECPARTREIMIKLKTFGILDRVLRLKSRKATKSELIMSHDPKLVELVKGSNGMSPRERHQLGEDFDSIYFNEFTWDSARLAVGNLLQVVDSVCEGESQSGMAVIRPPGHHAERAEPHGFCFFNNVCIATNYAMKHHFLKRILILDWDIHHGNGIQHCFEDSSSVLYISVHLFKGGNFFPFSKEADSNYVGKGSGIGYNINIPWSKSGMGDGDYIYAFTQIVLPVAYQFDPDLVIVSAGFDAAVNDPLGGCCVTPECYGHLTHLICSLANGKIILALEGGYNLVSISHSMTMCAKALLGDPLPPLSDGLAPSSSAVKVIQEVIGQHKEFWSCLKVHMSLAITIAPKPADVADSSLVSSKSSEEKSGDSEYLTPPESPSDINSLIRDFSALTTTSTPLPKLTTTSTPLPKLTTTSTPLPKLNTTSTPLPKLTTTSKPLPKLTTTSTPLPKLTTTSTPLPISMAAEGETEEEIPTDLEGAVGNASLTSDLEIAQMLQNESGLIAVVPLPWCEHLCEVRPLPIGGIDVWNSSCARCHDNEENWVCLVCYKVFCGRYVRGHMVDHGMEEQHNIVLSYADLSVWCYACESYIHNKIIFEAKQSAYWSKFEEDMPL